MKAKEFVQLRYPNAKCEKQVSGRIKGMQEIYYLIRDGINKMYMASGKTESKAWKEAKQIIEEYERTTN